MHYNYTTLFDHNYMPQALCLYDSLEKNVIDYTLYVITLDSEAFDFLTAAKYKNIIPIRLSDVENEFQELSIAKSNRSHTEYCWTLTPFSILYPIKKFNLDHCTYLDADIFFFSNPEPLYDLTKSVIITKHNFTAKYDVSEYSGLYCVQFMYFKNDIAGLKALNWWKDSCSKWCYKKFEDGKFGDQKYLDDWTTRFESVHVPNHIGCGVAPWNLQQFTFFNENNQIKLENNLTKQKDNIIFFHFCNIRKLNQNKWLTSFYETNDNAKKIIYAPYFELLNKTINISPASTLTFKQKLKNIPFLIKTKRLFDLSKQDFNKWIKNFSPNYQKKIITSMFYSEDN